MRAFLVACLAIVIVGTGGYYGLNTIQQPTGVAYSTDGARISPTGLGDPCSTGRRKRRRRARR